MKDLTVFVLTHNRGDILIDTVRSILNQTNKDFKFIISDNSTNDDTKQLLIKNNLFEKVEYKKRENVNKALDHFNLCIKETETKYFILFHDDDIMLPNYIDVMYNAIVDSNYVAVGCNAKKYQNNKILRNYCSIKRNKILTTQKELAYFYAKADVIPLPSYIYSKEKIENNFFSNECGKYSDAVWLLKLLEKYPIKLIAKPYMLYRLHNGQDSNSFDLINQLRLCKLLYKMGLNKKIYYDYRCRIIYTYAREKNKAYPLQLFKKYSPFHFYIIVILKKTFIFNIYRLLKSH